MFSGVLAARKGDRKHRGLDKTRIIKPRRSGGRRSCRTKNGARGSSLGGDPGAVVPCLPQLGDLGRPSKLCLNARRHLGGI